MIASAPFATTACLRMAELVNDSFDQRQRRRDYAGQPLRRKDLATDPLRQFARWLRAVADSGAKDATAMALATAGRDGAPSVRIVLLKHFDTDGFCWYGDYRSRKAVELAENPRASLAFYWSDFDRQVRIGGRVAPLAADASEHYFNSRPAESRFAAAASVQSAPIDNRASLQRAVESLQRRHPDDAPPRPAQWGGYRLCPDEYEFWQGQPGRLHDRFQYLKSTRGAWVVRRLQP